MAQPMIHSDFMHSVLSSSGVANVTKNDLIDGDRGLIIMVSSVASVEGQRG